MLKHCIYFFRDQGEANDWLFAIDLTHTLHIHVPVHLTQIRLSIVTFPPLYTMYRWYIISYTNIFVLSSMC